MAGLLELALAGGQSRRLVLKLPERSVVSADALVERSDLGLQAVALGLVGGALATLGVGLADAGFELTVASLALPDLLTGTFLEAVVLAKLQDVAEHLLALGWGASGEGVGMALKDEGRVGEGGVAHPQQPDDLGVRLADRIAADRAE